MKSGGLLKQSVKVLIVVILAGCVCPGSKERAEVAAKCEKHGGLHAINFSHRKPLECKNGKTF